MANRIKQFRTALGLTMRDLSEQTGVAIGYLSALENDCGEGTNPTKRIMEKIAAALGKTVPEVFYSESVETCR